MEAANEQEYKYHNGFEWNKLVLINDIISKTNASQGIPEMLKIAVGKHFRVNSCVYAGTPCE